MPQLAQFVISAPRDGLRQECGPRPATHERVRISAPRAGRYAAPRDRPIALEDLPCPGRAAWRWRHGSGRERREGAGDGPAAEEVAFRKPENRGHNPDFYAPPAGKYGLCPRFFRRRPPPVIGFPRA